jgi:hypothetical protein
VFSGEFLVLGGGFMGCLFDFLATVYQLHPMKPPPRTRNSPENTSSIGEGPLGKEQPLPVLLGASCCWRGGEVFVWENPREKKETHGKIHDTLW